MPSFVAGGYLPPAARGAQPGWAALGGKDQALILHLGVEAWRAELEDAQGALDSSRARVDDTLHAIEAIQTMITTLVEKARAAEAAAVEAAAAAEAAAAEEALEAAPEPAPKPQATEPPPAEGEFRFDPLTGRIIIAGEMTPEQAAAKKQQELEQKAKEAALSSSGDETKGNTALVDGVRKFAMDVRDLDIDLIDSINPFEAAYAVLAKSMNETVLKQVQSVISPWK